MIPGETYHEEIIQARLLTVLPELLDKVWKDDYGNILGIKKCGFGPTIMLSAHMDIKSEICKDSFLNKNGNIWRRSEGILGADDRAGIAMIINILKSICTLNFKGKLKIVFTVEEEEGQQGAENLDPDFYKNVDFAISLDRKNGSNIVTKSSSQQYCDEEYGRVFEKAASLLWDGMYPYKMVTGGISDLRVWSKEGIQSVNLSIGFYDEHMPGETLKIDEWHNTFELVSYVLGMLTTKYRQEKIFIPNIR
jgi:putative aminopeptidase FrvX